MGDKLKWNIDNHNYRIGYLVETDSTYWSNQNDFISIIHKMYVCMS